MFSLFKIIEHEFDFYLYFSILYILKINIL